VLVHNKAMQVSKISSWKYGSHKTAKKWANQMKERKWTEKQITDAISKGKQYDAINNVN
jgi:hypothetical protein